MSVITVKEVKLGCRALSHFDRQYTLLKWLLASFLEEGFAEASIQGWGY